MKSLITALLIVVTSTAVASPNITPGKWEYSIKLTSESGAIEAAMKEAKEMMASLPPEQREMMKQMMANQGVGFKLNDQTVAACITKEDIKTMSMPDFDENCAQKFTEESSNRYKITLICKGNPPQKGEGEFTIVSSKEFKGFITMEQMMQGKKDKVTMRQHGKLISETCSE